MNYTKSNPVGIDAKIQGMQSALYSQLNEKWGLGGSKVLDAFGRVYINVKDGKKIPEFYFENKEYKNVLVAETSKFFFIQRKVQTKQNVAQYKTSIELCFLVDLELIKSTVGHRADAEVHADVESVLTTFPNVYIESLETEIRNVFSGLDYEETDDMQPYHAFKFNLSVFYSLDETCKCC